MPLIITEIIEDEELNLKKNHPVFYKIIKSCANIIYESAKGLTKETEEEYSYNQPETVDIVPLINEVILQKKRPHQNIDFKFRSPSKLLAYCHPLDFKRVISNLMTNSIEAMKSDCKGSIFFDLYLTQSKDIKMCEITLSDNGQGIKKEVFHNVLEEGFSFGKTNGSGLGLSYAFRKVKSWDGDFKISSKEGKGTHIKILLPFKGELDSFTQETKDESLNFLDLKEDLG